MKKILISIASILLLLTACGSSAEKKAAEAKQKLETEISEYRSAHGGVGLPYNYDGPNTNSAAGVTPEK